VLCLDRSGALVVVSPAGQTLWRHDVQTEDGLELEAPVSTYSRDGATMYVYATSASGEQGIWSIPIRGGRARLVVRSDDPAIAFTGFLSAGPSTLFATVSEYESDIWVMRLRW